MVRAGALGREPLTRALAALAALAVLAVPLRAQQLAGAEPFAYVGYSRAWFAGEGAESVSLNVNGTIGGIGLRVPLARYVAARADLVLSRKGGRSIIDDPDSGLPPFQVDLEFVFLEVPLQLHLQDLREGTGFRPFGVVGIAPAFQLGCDLEVEVPDVGVARGACDDSTALGTRLSFTSPDIGVVGAVGVEWRLSTAVLQAQLRYSAGLRYIREDIEVRHRTLALLVGLGI